MDILNKLYINGQWVEGNGESRNIINPANTEVLAKVTDATLDQVTQAIKAARGAFDSWSATPAVQRSRLIKKLVQELRDVQDQMIDTVRDEVGCPTWFAEEVQVVDSYNALEKYADCCDIVDQEHEQDGTLIITEAIGVCAFITPWNYPLYQLVGKVGPALAAGCTMVLKPSEQSPLHALLFTQAVERAGIPAGVFNLVLGDGPEVGSAMVTDPNVDLVSFTGSTRAGVAITQASAPTIKRVCLELGGKSPLLITEGSDLEAAVKFGVDDVMLNSGQTCTALTRMLVPSSLYQEAQRIAKTHAESLVLANPNQKDAFMGPLSSSVQMDKVMSYIEIGKREGATLLCGGERATELGAGYYVKPTVFADVTNDMSIAREEIFGPVLCMIPYEGLEEGIRIANDTIYGLSARVFAETKEQGLAIAKRIRAGQVFVNDAQFNNFIPFGGYKQSGNGRESGVHGVLEFLETKAIPLT